MANNTPKSRILPAWLEDGLGEVAAENKDLDLDDLSVIAELLEKDPARLEQLEHEHAAAFLLAVRQAVESPQGGEIPARAIEVKIEAGQPRELGTAAADAGNGADGAAKVNRDGLPIKTGANVGLSAGMAQDGRTSIHDKTRPEFITATHTDADGKQTQQSFSLLESTDYHERVEKSLLDAGHTYSEAHRAATEAEHARMRQLGFDPNEIELKQASYIDEAAHRARALGNTTAEVTGEPYIDEAEDAMRADGGEPDPRFVLDRDGKKWIEPVYGHIMPPDKIEICSAMSQDGKVFIVMDPHSGMVIGVGSTRERADKAVKDGVKAKGLKFLRELLELQPPLSQQQLRARYADLYPEARIDAPPAAPAAPAVEMAASAPPVEVTIEPATETPKRGDVPMEHPNLAKHAEKLKGMARGAGWKQVGSRGVDSSGKEIKVDWIPFQPWFADVQRETKLPGNTKGDATRAAIRKAVAGHPMSAAERRHVHLMLAHAAKK